VLVAVLVKALIKNGASLNCVDEKGQTPLHLACLHGSGAAARVLLEYGAKPHTSDLVRVVVVVVCSPD